MTIASQPMGGSNASDVWRTAKLGPAPAGGGISSAADQIAQRLRAAIAFAELAPGTPLKQEELAQRLGVSRVPLREAMRRLASEGLIDWPTNRSALVRALSYQEIEELFALGQLLETRATRIGVPKLAARDLAKLARLNEEMLSRDLTLPDWYRTNLNFHMIPMVQSGQTRTLEIVIETRLNLTRYFLSPGLYERPHDDWRMKHAAEHQRLLEAFKARDPDAAGKLIEQHWLSTWLDWQPHLAALSDPHSAGPNVNGEPS